MSAARRFALRNTLAALTAVVALSLMLAGASGCGNDHDNSRSNISEPGLSMLWIANSANNTVAAFAPGQLTADGTPSPAIVLSNQPAAGALNVPIALAFDNRSDLWVANIGNNTVVEFTPAQFA